MRYLAAVLALLQATLVEASAAELRWPPRSGTMLSRNVSCVPTRAGMQVLVRSKDDQGAFSVRSTKGKLLPKLNRQIERFQKKLKKRRLAHLRPEFKKTLKQLKKQANLITNCARRLGTSVGCPSQFLADASLVVAIGNEREVGYTVQTSCEGVPELSIVEPPAKGALVLSGGRLHYTASHSDGTGQDGAEIQLCFRSANGLIDGCSPSTLLPISRCQVSGASRSYAILENQNSFIPLSKSSDCGASASLQIVESPQNGSVTISGESGATFSTDYYAGNDSFSYRVCDDEGAGCSPAETIALSVLAGANFQGDENSLAPYREHASREEREHLVRKVANNRFDLIAGAGQSLSLSELLSQRFLSEEILAPDLRGALQEVQSRALVYGFPISSEEFIPDWRSDFPAGTSCADSTQLTPDCYQPILPASLDLSSDENVRYGMERFAMTTVRSWHGGFVGANYRYHWGGNRMTSYYFQRTRYLSPVHARLMHFWMGHFGTATQILNGVQENVAGYYVKTIEREALGNFKYLMLGRPEVSDENGCAPLTHWEPEHGSILCDLASNLWLTNIRNLGLNQNFARELLELYLTSPRDELANVDNYSDPGDIVAASRFVSGMDYGFKTVGGRSLYAQAFDPDMHDDSPSSMFTELEELSPTLAVVGESFEPGDLVRHILDNHPGAPRFIAGKLFSMFVYPDPSEALVGELGESFKELNYDIKQFMNMILRSEAMFSARAAGKNCITNPLDAYSRILNTVRYPLIPYVHSNSVNNLYSAIIDNRFVSSGEVLLGYPSVFTHDYCGRSEGKDGSTSWLPSHLLVFRVINLTKMLTDFTWNMRNQYDLSEALTLIRSEPEFSDGSAESVIAFFERAFDLRLDEVERGILTEYMNHTRTGAGALVSAPWNPDNQARVREKIAGLMVIMAGFHQATTH